MILDSIIWLDKVVCSSKFDFSNKIRNMQFVALDPGASIESRLVLISFFDENSLLDPVRDWSPGSS